MDNNALTPDVLRELRTPRPYPAVSLSMPTHRRDPHIDEDAVRLRNLLAEAWRRLETEPGIDRQAKKAVKSRLGRAVADVDLRQPLDGLLIYADTLDYRIWYLPRAVPERVVLSDTYVTRNLVAAGAQTRPYWVLAVAADRATLWSGTVESLEEHRNDGFPMTQPADAWDVERRERIGDRPSTYTDEETRQFLRSVDQTVAPVLARRPQPLFLVGLAPALSLLADAGRATQVAAGRLVNGGLTEGPASLLLKELTPVIEEYEHREQEEVLARLDEAKGRRTFAAGLDEVWESVRDKRAGLVALEEHYRRTALVREGHLMPVDDLVDAASADGLPLDRVPLDGVSVDRTDVRDDIVDELVEAALDGNAEVVFLPDDALAGHDRIAAVLRY